MWRREYVVAKIGMCGMADWSLKLSLLRQVVFVVFIFILRIHISCLALPPTQIPIHNSMSTPQEHKVLRAKVMADIERANAVMADLARAEKEEQRAAEEAERKRVEVEASGGESRAEASGGGGEEETRTRGVQMEGGGGDSEAGGHSKGREGIEGDQTRYARRRTSSNVREEARGNGGEREDETGEGGVGRRRYDSRRDSGGVGS